MTSNLGEESKMKREKKIEKMHIIGDIGAGTGPAGPAMAGPFSAEVETV